MVKTPPSLSIHPARFFSLPFPRRVALLAVVCLITAIGSLYMANFSALPVHNLYTIGALAEVINVLTLLFMFWVVQCAQVHSKTYLSLSIGLSLWLVSGTIDVVDEAYFQPWWLSTVEDSLRTLGMLATAWGVLLMVQQMYGAQVRLVSLAMLDELTGLSNRRSFRSVLEGHAGEETPLLLLDLDHFKQINDRYGHGIGDNVLREFGGLLRQHCSSDGVVARLGGEEFAIWLPGIPAHQASVLAEQIRRETESLVSSDGVQFTVSIAIGIGQVGEAVETLIKRTDLALYRAKHQGRNRVELA